MTRAGTKKLLRIAAWSFGGLMLACALVLAGTLVWLRTPAAERTLATLLTRTMAEQGLTLTMDSLSGPLPQRLLLSNPRLSDSRGLWFSAAELELRVRPLALLGGVLELPLLRLDTPELLRLPELPQAKPTTVPSATGQFSLPIAIDLGDLRLEKGRVHAAVLQGAGQETKKTQILQPLSLNAAGSGRASNSALTADIHAALLHPDKSGFELMLQAGSATGKGQNNLTLRLSAKEAQGGAMAVLLGQPDLPAYAGTLYGTGSLNDWHGSLDFAAGERKTSTENSPDFIDTPLTILTVQGELTLAAQNRTSWLGLIHNRIWQAALSLNAAPGKKTSAAMQAILGTNTTLSLKANARDGIYTVEQADMDSASWQVVARDISAAPQANGTTILRGQVNGSMKNGALLHAFDAESTWHGTPLLQRASLSASLSGESGGSSQWFKAEGEATAKADSEDFALSYGLHTTLAGSSATLHTMRLEGLGINATASGTFDTVSRAADATASVTAKDKAPWQVLLSRLSGHEGSPFLGGELRLDASLQNQAHKSESTPDNAKGTLRLAGTAMRWPSPLLQDLLGPELALDAQLSSSASTPEASFSPAYILTLDTLRAGQLKGRGELRYTPAGMPREAATPLRRQDASLVARLALELSTITPLAPGFSGPAQAQFEARGPLQNLSLSATASSPGLETPAGRIRDLAARADASVSSVSGAYSASGQAQLTVGQSPAGPARLNTDWTLQAPANAESTAAVRRLTAQIAGASLSADMQVRFPQAGPARSLPPLLSGSASVQLTDWSGVAGLSCLPLSGGPASLTARLDTRAQEQVAQVHLSLNSLKLAGAGKAQTVRLNKVSGTFAADRLFSTPAFSLMLSSAKGSAGLLSWKSGAAKAQGANNSGAFSLALRADAKASQAVASPDTSAVTPAPPEKAERLALQGNFRTAQPAVKLNRLVLQVPEPATGLHLLAPVTIDLARGLQVKGLRLKLMPGGTLDGDASFTAGKTELDAAITALPLSIARLFTDAPLPDGSLDAALSLKRAGNTVQGQAQISATLTPQLYSGENLAAVSPLLFTLQSTLGQVPDPQFTNLRSLPGITRLRGQGTLALRSANATQAPDLTLAFDLPLHFTSSGVPVPDFAAPMAARMTWNGPAGPLWRLVPMPDRILTGQGEMDLALSGTLAAPLYKGTVFLAGGRYEDRTLGLLLTGIDLEARSNEKGALQALLKAGDSQGGTLALEASLLPAQSVPTPPSAGNTTPTPPAHGPRLSLRGQINHLEPVHRDDVFLRLSGIFSADGPLAAPDIGAKIIVERGEVNLLSTFGGGVRTLDVVDAGAPELIAPAKGPTCNVEVSVPGRFFIRSRALDSEWEGTLRVNGPLSKPALTGSLSPVRGRFDLLSRPFSFTSGAITFLGGDRINPDVDLELTYTRPSITAIVRVGGTASKPTLVLESTPILPQDQILSEVLFGKNPSNLSRFEALQLANGLRELAGIGSDGLNPLTTMRRTLGVDVLRLGSSSGSSQSRATSGAPGADSFSPGGPTRPSEVGDDSTPTIEAGQYINDVIYVGVEQGVAEGSTGVRVEMELLPNVTLQGSSSGRSSEVGIGWKRDY